MSETEDEKTYDSLAGFVADNRDWVKRTIAAQTAAKAGDPEPLREILAEIEAEEVG